LAVIAVAPLCGSFGFRRVFVIRLLYEPPGASGATLGARCYAVSANADGRGFSSVDMNGLQATYDSNKGLLISAPVYSYDPDKGSVPVGRVKVRISRKNNNNSVTIEK
jgi:hypothetical protein